MQIMEVGLKSIALFSYIVLFPYLKSNHPGGQGKFGLLFVSFCVSLRLGLARWSILQVTQTSLKLKAFFLPQLLTFLDCSHVPPH